MQLNRMSVEEIVEVIDDLSSDPDWIVLSGGNPALLDLEYLVNSLHKAGYKVMVETQGTVFQLWLLDCDEICISPKPPSSGTTGFESEFMLAAEQNPKFYMKIVVFDEEDYDWASDMRKMYPKFDMFLSVGNEDPTLPTVSNPNPATENITGITREVVLDKTRWLFEKVANDPRMRNVRVMPQLHTLAWGNVRGR